VTTTTAAAKTSKTTYYADLDDAAAAAQTKANKTGRPQYVNLKPNGLTVDAKAAKALMATRIPEGTETAEKADPATASKPRRAPKTGVEESIKADIEAKVTAMKAAGEALLEADREELSEGLDLTESEDLDEALDNAVDASLDRLQADRLATEQEYVAARKAEQAKLRDEANAHIGAIHERNAEAIKAGNAKIKAERIAKEKAAKQAAKTPKVESTRPAADATYCPRCGAELVTNLKGKRVYTCGLTVLDKGTYTIQTEACETYRTAARMGWDAEAWQAAKYEPSLSIYRDLMGSPKATKEERVAAANELVEAINEASAVYDLSDLGTVDTKVVSKWWQDRINTAITAINEAGAGTAPALSAPAQPAAEAADSDDGGIPMVEVDLGNGETGLRHRNGLVVFTGANG
jgi:hypothetical protein